MDKPRELRGPNTPQIELVRILTWLIKNGFEMEETGEVYDRDVIYDDDAVVHFKKDIAYTEESGNYINDSSMKVSVQFEKRSDYKHIIESEDGDREYEREPYEFIDELIGKIQKKHRKSTKNRTRKKYKSI